MGFRIRCYLNVEEYIRYSIYDYEEIQLEGINEKDKKPSKPPEVEHMIEKLKKSVDNIPIDGVRVHVERVSVICRLRQVKSEQIEKEKDEIAREMRDLTDDVDDHDSLHSEEQKRWEKLAKRLKFLRMRDGLGRETSPLYPPDHPLHSVYIPTLRLSVSQTVSSKDLASYLSNQLNSLNINTAAFEGKANFHSFNKSEIAMQIDEIRRRW